MSGASGPTQEQVQGPTQNNQLSIIEEEEHTQRLTHVKWDVDAVKATMGRIEATLELLAQGMNSQALQQPEAWLGPSTRQKARKSSGVSLECTKFKTLLNN